MPLSLEHCLMEEDETLFVGPDECAFLANRGQCGQLQLVAQFTETTRIITMRCLGKSEEPQHTSLMRKVARSLDNNGPRRRTVERALHVLEYSAGGKTGTLHTVPLLYPVFLFNDGLRARLVGGVHLRETGKPPAVDFTFQSEKRRFFAKERALAETLAEIASGTGRKKTDRDRAERVLEAFSLLKNEKLPQKNQHMLEAMREYEIAPVLNKEPLWRSRELRLPVAAHRIRARTQT